MTIKTEPYEKNDQIWVDKDPDPKHTYVIDVTSEMVKNAINAVGVIVAETYRMTVTKGPTLEKDGLNTYVKYQVKGPTPPTDLLPDDAHVTIRVTGDGDGDECDCTVYFNPTPR